MLRSVCSDRPAAGLVPGEINNMDAALHWELAPTGALEMLMCVSITSHSHDVTLNLSSMVLRVVEVLMLQVPASSVMSIWRVDTLRNSSYWSAEVLV